MASINTSGRPAYMYDEDTDTWYAISGRVSTSANYVWTGAQTYSNNVVVNGALTATLKFNSFLNPAARASAITSPQTGLISFIQQDPSGNTVNKFQYYNGSAWTDLNTVSYSSGEPNYPSEGNIWVDSDNNNIFVYDGSVWNSISGGATKSFSMFLAGM